MNNVVATQLDDDTQRSLDMLDSVDEFLTEKETIEILNLSRQMLYKMRAAGTLGNYKKGAQVFYSAKEVRDVLIARAQIVKVN
jgi:predicted DNA-binding transcriptional regulator AlpA